MPETLPVWIWIIHYIVLLLTLVFALKNLKNKRSMLFSALVTLTVLALPPLGFSLTFFGDINQNEAEIIMNRLANGDFTAIILILGYAVVGLWWIMFISKTVKKKNQGKSIYN
ncbi:hypothetical protein [Rossellomorea marisflavi]|uniref:hypothetical protein n=1 Tax=Rossellomorea marisflavi TaxID=189381 RepID=UPI00064F5C0D|nr:hypothetical protein [Rossellomorea marisflavi]KML32343.1 hypothetical protein VL12_15160 [Rossellomorea marisflavi]